MSVKVNRIELDKTRGLTVQVVNGVNTQTIVLDGEQLTITVVGPEGTSTIEQTPTAVTVTADSFIVNARTIRATGSLEATISAGETRVALTPKAAMVTAPEIDLTGAAKLEAAAPMVSLTGGEEVKLTAAPLGKLSIDGNTVTTKAETEIQIGALSITLAGAIKYVPA